MNIQLFLIMIFIVLPSAASERALKPTIKPHLPAIDITIDDKITHPEQRTIEVTERFSDPHAGDKEYKLRLQLDKQKKVWRRKYYETTYTQEDWRCAALTPTTVPIGKLPKAVKNAFDSVLDDAILSHIYLHRQERLTQIWEPAHKKPLTWLAHLPTLRRTEWVWCNEDQSTLLMNHTDPYRKRLKRNLDATRALYEASKKDADKVAHAAKEAKDPDLSAAAKAASDRSAADKKAYEDQFTSFYSLLLNYQTQDTFGENFMLWKKGTFQEMQRQGQLAAHKKETFEKGMAAALNRANAKPKRYTSSEKSKSPKLNTRDTFMLQEALRKLNQDLLPQHMLSGQS
jgi:hypothetical protein